MHLTVGVAQTAIRQAGPEDGVHLSHVGAPEHKVIGGFQVVITAHGFIDTKGTHKADHGRGHTVAGIGVDIVGAETCLVQLGAA